jgi:crotonobetainyl-CoA hydratase
MSDSEAVKVERIGHVMVITINRPEARNACNQAVWLGGGEALVEAEADVNVRAIIVTGAGEQSFCAGADLKAIARGERIVPEDPVKAAWGFAGIVRHVISKPIIAAVNGTALGGGTELAMSCDLIVAADVATFGLPEVKRGLLAGAGGAFRIVEQLPRKVGMQVLLTGDPITAAQARDWGLVNEVVTQAEVVPAALRLAERIAANAPLSVQASKRIALGIKDGRMPGEEFSWELCGSESAAVGRSEDAREGPRAFAEKRAPHWQGR